MSSRQMKLDNRGQIDKFDAVFNEITRKMLNIQTKFEQKYVVWTIHEPAFIFNLKQMRLS